MKTLFNFDPPATKDEIANASLQFVRKISGFTKPSQVNQKAFDQAVSEISNATQKLINQLETTAPPKNREEEAKKVRLRAVERFGTS